MHISLGMVSVHKGMDDMLLSIKGWREAMGSSVLVTTMNF